MHDTLLHEEHENELPKPLQPWWDIPIRSLDLICPDSGYVPSNSANTVIHGSTRSGGMGASSWGMVMGVVNIINNPS